MIKTRGDGLLAAHQLSVRWAGFELSVPSLLIRAGSCVGLLGANGAGKTTLLRALAGRLRLDAGEVQLDSVLLAEWGFARGMAVGYVPDTLEGLSWMTAREHLTLRRRAFPTWDADYAEQLLGELDIPTGKPLQQLSKGTLTKLAFASVEAYRPPVLLLDEPTAGLDPVVRRKLHEVVLRMIHGVPHRAVMFSTHLVEDIERIADRVLVMNDGRIRDDAVLPEHATASERRILLEEAMSTLGCKRDIPTGEMQ